RGRLTRGRRRGTRHPAASTLPASANLYFFPCIRREILAAQHCSFAVLFLQNVLTTLRFYAALQGLFVFFPGITHAGILAGVSSAAGLPTRRLSLIAAAALSGGGAVLCAG